MTATLLACLLMFDDGALTSSGAPTLLDSHVSVRMVREEVEVDIGPKTANVRCKFWFKNEGPATSVRIGFPEDANGSYETEYGESLDEAEQKKRPKPIYEGLDKFKSWVDGREVSTTMIAAKAGDKHLSYHVKQVAFTKDQTHLVVDTYTQPVGLGSTSYSTANETRLLHEFQYILQSGASWQGPIGDIWVTVRFHRKHMGARLEAAPISSKFKDNNPFNHNDWDKVPGGQVYWSGVGKPRVDKNVLIFHRRNWKPNEDLYMVFDYCP